ncbi:MAG: tryptophan synthase subunit beta [Chloroflexi bacterium]|nr:tryptophan synthase subunit beta [Chloroflexota bacterium]
MISRSTRFPLPTAGGRYGIYGGRFVPETLMAPLIELEAAYASASSDPAFWNEYESMARSWAGRPTPVYHAKRFTAKCGGAAIYLKREDLAHTGAHKINNALGQGLLARRMGKKRILAETGAGQHGVAVATVCTMLGMECIVYMGEEDVRRQSHNVFRMKVLGADVRPVASGSRTLKDAITEAMRDWITNVRDTYYMIGSVIGPHPYPMIVRDFQSIIGREAREQMLAAAGRLPDCVVACVGGGSNAMGAFYRFLDDEPVRLIGVEAGGTGFGEGGKSAASLCRGKVGVFHGAKTYYLQDDQGQIAEAHSIAAGLDYPGVGPELSYLRDVGRVECVAVTDEQAVEGFHMLSRAEGIMPAMESSHAVYHASKLAPSLPQDKIVLINVSGRGDKDLDIIARAAMT